MWHGSSVDDNWGKMQDTKILGSLPCCPIESLKLTSGMDFQLLWGQAEHGPVTRVWHKPELRLCYPEFSVSCQSAYSSPEALHKASQLIDSPQHWPLLLITCAFTRSDPPLHFHFQQNNFLLFLDSLQIPHHHPLHSSHCLPHAGPARCEQVLQGGQGREAGA